ncbi:DUF4251 domain-containing protein [Pedobacter panaciterrae]|uniref:DUF4251 domain-containing protein n=1 Tax=Pedobacter panaciterrae TaxID=363849 RepID=UPI00155D9A09|nr:DUF4251 domain-containing protein [Pedobacter panaciterrae]NQX54951.1 DUF4251 domain-containing protein [Pedobacter panaciterrae]
MKTLKNTLLLVIMFIAIQVSAQTDKETTAKLVEAKTLVFNATTALPMANMDLNKVLQRFPGGQGSGAIQLSGSQYTLTIAKDSVEAYLPYYGRAYSANLNPNDSGIKFKSKDFTYKTEKRKKGGWLITIRPKDTKDVQSLTLSVGEKGYAVLNVTSNYRQAIAFNGFISEPVAKSNNAPAK